VCAAAGGPRRAAQRGAPEGSGEDAAHLAAPRRRGLAAGSDVLEDLPSVAVERPGDLRLPDLVEVSHDPFELSQRGSSGLAIPLDLAVQLPRSVVAVAGSSLRETYVDLLLDRVRQENYPNPDQLDRIAAAVRSPEQLLEYVQVLLSKVERTRYPSGAILDRLDRLANMS
jgi:hypothetical protein